jgi:ribonuclease BN (tRNA processing enzyme)
MKELIDRAPARTRRALLKDAIRLLGAGAAAQLGSTAWVGSRAFAQTITRLDEEQDSGSVLVMLGTQGGPSVNLRRSETASAVVIDGVPYLLDCGYGTVRALVQSGIGIGVPNVFITHLHDDHTIDLAALLSLQWTGRRMEPTAVYGPYGTKALVGGALEFFKGNTEIRIVDEVRSVRPEDLFSGHDIEATSKPTKAFEDDRVRILTVENTHFPERAMAKMPYRSLAYRFDMADRSIVFSGDTAYSKNLVELARGADIFVCEAMDVAQHDRLAARAKEAAERGEANAGILRHVVETHSTTEQVGRMAAEAGVNTVVLYHLLPGSNGPLNRELQDTTYIAGVNKFFDGEVIVGRDQMRL